MKTNGLREAPYDSWGSLLHWADPRQAPGTWAAAAEWRPNDPMELTLTVDHVQSGRSAKYTVWITPNGVTYPMFISDLIEMLREVTITDGTIHAMFRVRKRGQNFGLCYDGKVPTT
jgi:hypothetical protein